MDDQKTGIDLFETGQSGENQAEPLEVVIEPPKKDYLFQILKWQAVIAAVLLIAALAAKYSGLSFYKTLQASFKEYYLAQLTSQNNMRQNQNTVKATAPGTASADPTSGPTSAPATTALTGDKLPVNATMLQMAIPVTGQLSSGFGERQDPMDGTPEFHHGLDFAVNVGTAVRAALAGTVQAVGDDPEGYGNYIILNHTGGIQTIYGHLSKVDVKTNENISKGQEIGLTGSTGRSTGPHLHFEVRVNGTAIDPRWVLPIDNG